MPRRDVDHHSPVAVYDFTFFGPKGGSLPDYESFIKLLQPLAKRWVFQLEACPETDRHHFQGRMSLIKKRRQPELCGVLNASDLRGMDVSESSNESKSREIFYAMKQETRLDGPWSDVSYHPPPYIPRQYRGLIDRLYPWQQTVLDSRLQFEDRLIDVIVDPTGCNGKSTVASLGRLYFGCLDLPPISDHKELLQIVENTLRAKDCRTPGIVFVDCPRSLDQKRMGPYFIAIEQIKKGYVADVRYHFTDWDFDSPRVWVFMNHHPNVNAVSLDRWRFHFIDPTTRELSPYVPMDDEPPNVPIVPEN